MSAPRLLAPTTISGGVPTAGAGTLNTIALWTPDGNTLGNSLLTQAGNVTINSGTFRTADGSNTEPGYTFSNSSGSGMYRGTSGTVLRFASSGTFAFGVSSAQNVLIGGSATTAPSARLQVVGIANNNAAYLSGSTTVGQSFGAFIEAGTNASDRSFAVYNSGVTSPYLVVRGDGNVGIGTASPGVGVGARGLDIYGVDAQYRLHNAASGPNATDGFLMSLDTNANAYLWNYEAQSLIFGTSNLERARIDSAGNFGVATSTMVAPGLTITDPTNTNNIARLNLRNTNSDGGNRIATVGYSGNAIQLFTASETTGTANNLLALFQYNNAIFYTGTTATNPVERARIDSSGNFGIGTASPAGRLHVSQADVTLGVLFNGTTKGVRFGFTAGTSSIEGVDNTGNASYQPLNINGSLLTLATGNTERARIDSAGRLLVGVSGVPVSSEIKAAIGGAGNGGQEWIGATGGGIACVPINGGGGQYYTFTGLIGAESYTASFKAISTGLDVSTSGYGLKLPATPGNADTQTLDCYLDGGASGGATWAPVDNSGAGLTFTVTSARYMRIGRLVLASFDITFPATASGAQAKISLPVTAQAVWQGASIGFGPNVPGLAAAVNNADLNFWTYGAATTNAALSGARLIVSMSYFAS